MNIYFLVEGKTEAKIYREWLTYGSSGICVELDKTATTTATTTTTHP